MRSPSSSPRAIPEAPRYPGDRRGVNIKKEPDMARTIDLGVFLPVTNNGWIISKNSPKFLPTFELNRDVCKLAERIGFSYAFSMAKWRGFGGATDFWKHSVESTMLTAGLAAHVSRMRLIASVAPVLIHPAIFAKMAATVDEIAGGRFGINIVSAGNPGEYSQMGLYPENFEEFRYDYTEEWLTLVKRLWTEDAVTHKGRYFTLDDCESWPKPVQSTVPIVCATSSERGFRFVAEHCTAGFFGGSTVESDRAQSRRMKEVAAANGCSVRTHALSLLIQGDSDADAQRMLDHYEAGADLEAIDSIYHKRSSGNRQDRTALLRDRFTAKDMRLFYGGIPIVGGPERVAALIEEHAVDGEVDGIMFVFPDFIDGLTRFGEGVMPILRNRGVVRDVSASTAFSST
jgi:pyrimidine oxygenase